MSLSKARLLLLPVFIALAFLLGTVVAREGAKPPEAKAQSTDVPASCGQKLANYMNAIISGAGSLSGIRITSPIFNLTNPREFAIYQSMQSAGANWSGLDAFAGNTYRISGNSPYFYYATNPSAAWRSVFGGRDVIFSEFGNYDQQNGAGNQNVPVMTSDFSQAAADGTIIGINYFNAMGTGNSNDWGGYEIFPSEFSAITGGNSKAGVNSAAPVNGN